MTRKDYVKIASVIATHIEISNEEGRGDQIETLEFLAGDLAHMLHRDNPRFNRDKFLAACGVKS
jgi:hypothetical protein